MSKVTDVVILCSLNENIFGGGVEFLNNKICSMMESLKASPLVNITKHAGGNKNVQGRIYAGAINYLYVDEFIELVKAAPWSHPATVQVLLQQEHECGFKRICLE